ncbi:glycine--tRNA ligase subunit alpha, partial [Listeria monocytogenes]|uniref:glycine--tRNA ligase subunit alpha n=1 Tax=Listeria monocytogenes TaxID=1639 RepID=UPI001F514B7D
LECFPVTSEITYGVERLASYIQAKENVFDLEWTEGISSRDIFFQAEFENSTYAFETSNKDMLLTLFDTYEREATRQM